MNERVVTELVIDASGSVTGAAQYVDAMRAAERERDKVADAEEKLRRATESTTAVLAGRSQSIANVRRDYERLRATTDQFFATQLRHEQELQRAVMTTSSAIRRGITDEQEGARLISSIRQRQVSELDAVKQAAMELNQVQGRGAAGAAGQFNTANLAAQFQDIAVTSAMGMSPLQIALQQGTQISAVLGPLGAAGAVKSLGAAFLSVINPVSLATIAIVGAGAAAAQYFFSTESEAAGADAAIERHGDLISSLKQKYGEALDGAKGYYAESLALERARLQAAEGDFEDVLEKASQSVLDSILSRPASDFGPTTPLFDEMRRSVDEFSASIDRGEPALRQFLNQWAAFEIDPNATEEQRALARAIRETESAVEGMKADDFLRQIDAIGDAAIEGAGKFDQFSTAIERLSQIALPALSDAEAAAEAFSQAMAAAQGLEDRRAAIAQLDAAMQRIRNQEEGAMVPVPTPRPNDFEAGLDGPRPAGTGMRRLTEAGVGVTTFGATEEDIRAGFDSSEVADHLSGLYGPRGFGSIDSGLTRLGGTIDTSVQSLNDLWGQNIQVFYASISDAVRTSIVTGMAEGRGDRQQYTSSMFDIFEPTNRRIEQIDREIDRLHLLANTAGSLAATSINAQIAGLELKRYDLESSRSSIDDLRGGMNVSYAGGFADGGTFIVPGSSRQGDRNRVMLDANAGERVTVTPAGATAQPIVLNYHAARGESEATAKQNARAMWEVLNREAARQ